MLPRVPKIAIPKVPAGMPTSYVTRSARLDTHVRSYMGGVFGSQRRTVRSIALSPREALTVAHDKKLYDDWLAKWERDPGIGRFLMLKNFVNQCSGMSKSQLDQLFGNASELVFIHIYTFLRLNYHRGCSIALQLKALRIFFEASSGYCFAHHFLSTNGNKILLDLLKDQENLSTEDIEELLGTFMALTAHGPEVVGALADDKFIEVFTGALAKLETDEMHKVTVELLVQLAEGNADVSDIFLIALRSHFHEYDDHALNTASRIYRLLLVPELAADIDIKNTISDYMPLTKSPSLDVQNNGIAIFQTLIDNLPGYRRKFVLDTITDMMSVNVDEVSDEVLDEKLRQQAFAVRLILSILTNNTPSVKLLCNNVYKLLPVLMRTVGNSQNFPAQKAACLALVKYVSVMPEVKTYLCNTIPNEWVNSMLTRPKDFSMKLTPTQLETFHTIDETSFVWGDQREELTASMKEPLEIISDTSSVAASFMSTQRSAPPKIVMRESPLKFMPCSNPTHNPRFRKPTQ